MNTLPTIPGSNMNSHPNPALRGILAVLTLITGVIFFIIYWIVAPSGAEGAVNIVVLMLLLMGIVVLSALALSIKPVLGAIIGWCIIYILGFGGLVYLNLEQKWNDEAYARKQIEQNQVGKAGAERTAQNEREAPLIAQQATSLVDCGQIKDEGNTYSAWQLCVANNFNISSELSTCLEQAAIHSLGNNRQTPRAFCYGQLSALENSEAVCQALTTPSEQLGCLDFYGFFKSSGRIYPGARNRAR